VSLQRLAGGCEHIGEIERRIVGYVATPVGVLTTVGYFGSVPSQLWWPAFQWNLGCISSVEEISSDSTAGCLNRSERAKVYGLDVVP
jgi:hypothetical protein